VIRRDLDLTYKLLRFINSSYFGVITEVRSIKQALVLLGFDEIRKWVSLTLLDNLAKDKPSELIRQSILRAKFCEEIAERVGKSEESAEFFLMGMFTVINALINKPMAQILAELPLANDMKVALLGRNNRYRKVLEAVLAYERGDWYQFDYYAKELKLDSSEIPAIYNSALQWVDQVS
jgi:EAL and modified HD-GYP domain-containing signal transduction protein